MVIWAVDVLRDGVLGGGHQSRRQVLGHSEAGPVNLVVHLVQGDGRRQLLVDVLKG